MQLKGLLLRFNVSHFIFYCISLILCVLTGLRLDNIINTQYGVIFTPLWMWNVAIVIGLIVGVVRWCKSTEQRQDEQFVYQFKSMIVSVLLQALIIITQVLVVVNLDVNGTLIPWSAVFCPLYLLMFVSIPSCIWGCYRKRGIEIELLSMCTFVQFIFLGIRLDNVVKWNWAIVMIPFWLFYLSFVVALVIIGIATILFYVIGENQQSNEDRKLPDAIFFIFSTFFSIFIIIFMCLLVVRINNNVTIHYSVVFIPLHLSILMLIGTTFSRKPANVWWFGIRKNAIDFMLDCCPLLTEYANVSYRKERERNINQNSKRLTKLKHLMDVEEAKYCYEDIYTPD